MATTTSDVLAHHMTCFGNGDLAGVLSDYTSESRIFTQDGVLRGSEPIRGLFQRLLAEFGKPGASFEMIRQDVDGDAAYIVWKAETADNRFEMATDTFIVRNGKILIQTYAAKTSPNRKT